ncbi:MAG: hypothetical protein B7X41_14890 [Microbacterium sp. 14-71-5]|nr:MAG: hypothetical protein B7X41_14890 [Microbacterium sp. 14-71-5]
MRLIDIADHSEVSIGSLQHRFRNRSTLLHSAIVLADEKSRKRVVAAFSEIKGSWQRLHAQIDHLAGDTTHDTETGYWLELLSASSRNPELYEAMHTQQEYWLEVLETNLEQGLDSGELRSALDAGKLAATILALIDGLFASRVFGDRYQDFAWVRGLIYDAVHALVQQAGTEANRTESA